VTPTNKNAIRSSATAAVRLAVATVAGLAALVIALLVGGSWAVAVSVGWCTLALVVLVWVWSVIGPKDAEETRRHAGGEDLSRPTAGAVLVSASVVSLVGVAFALIQAGRDHGAAKTLLIALVVLTVALGWATIHTVYTLRYGDLYYNDPVGGINFHDDDPPDYIDFAYVSLTIGMTFQVSDTDIQSRPIRRTAVKHALLSYLFGAVIVAVTINVVAGLLSR
jgi:uncharacterized membrane protein